MPSKKREFTKFKPAPAVKGAARSGHKQKSPTAAKPKKRATRAAKSSVRKRKAAPTSQRKPKAKPKTVRVPKSRPSPKKATKSPKKAAPKRRVPREIAATKAAKLIQQLARAWNVGETDIVAAKKKAVESGYPKNQLIEFLYAKGLSDGPGVAQDGSYKSRFNLIAKPDGQTWMERKAVLMGILGIPTPESERMGDQRSIPKDLSFDHFVAAHPEWSQGSSFVVFRDHPLVKGKRALIQREQIFGMCAIHAPVVMQHYLLAMASQGTWMGTLDIPLWIRRHAAPQMLEGVVFRNGVNSDQVLRSIIMDSSEVGECYQYKDIAATLESFGPLLVPLWSVTPEFHGCQKWHYLGPTSTSSLFHSMLIVGYRTVEDGKSKGVRLLLQNWWHSMQFVEVDEDYYKSCAPFHNPSRPIYVKTPQVEAPTYETTNAVFSVSTVDGAGVAGVGGPPAGRIVAQNTSEETIVEKLIRNDNPMTRNDPEMNESK